MAIEDIEVYNVYKCTNHQCCGKFGALEKLSDPWCLQCPACKEESLILDSGHASYSTFIDMNKPKTIGAISDENMSRMEKDGTSPKKDTKTPFWRNKKKINFDVLKSPQNYIMTGET